MGHKEENRSIFLDNVCGVLILYMIFYHFLSFLCISRYDNLVLRFLTDTFSFFMTWFFFKNGMFFKSAPQSVIWTSTKRLLFPFVVCTIIGLIIEVFYAYSLGRSIDSTFFRSLVYITLNLHPFHPVAHIWFLMSLWVVRLAFFLFDKIGFPTLVFAGISLLLAMGCNWLAYKYHYVVNFSLGSRFYRFDFPPMLGNVFHGMFCFAMGYFLKDKQYLTKVFICSVLLFVFRYIFVIRSDMRTNSTSDPYYVFYVLYGLAGCISINNISKRFFNRKLSLLTYMGKNSMGFYLGHYTIMYILFVIFNLSFDEMDVLPRSIAIVALFVLIVVASDLIYKGVVRCFSIGCKK